MTTTTTHLPMAAHRHLPAPELLVAIGAFAALCLAVLLRSTALLEPDDYAYRASIVALADGHISLTNGQYQALAAQLGSIAQWVQLPNGSWLSEKNPGYPFFAAPFQLLGLLRVAPLFYGALACAGLYAGGRRWLGRWGGTWAVALYCGSAAAIVFAWRATMPTFTDASLIAAGIGAFLWTMLATDAGLRKADGRRAARIPRTRRCRCNSLHECRRAARRNRRGDARAASCPAPVALARLEARLHRDARRSSRHFQPPLLRRRVEDGVQLRRDHLWPLCPAPNLEEMPYHLVRSMPFLLLGLIALGWMGIRAARSLRDGVDTVAASLARRDAAVGGALGACWLGIFGLYAAYTWTVSQAANHGLSLHVIRFYLPALGAIALLAAWLLTQLPRLLAGTALIALVCLAAITYPGLANSGPGGPGGPGGGFPSGPPQSGGFPGGPPPTGGLPEGTPPSGAAPAAGAQAP